MPSNVIYAPTIASSLPAFLADSESMRIPFQLSDFNNMEESGIKCAHISVSYQPSGANSVNLSSHPSGLIINREIKEEAGKYYVELESEDLEQGFQMGQVYKVQLRLSSVIYEDESIGVTTWLKDNMQYFSEWSTVCLIKAIPKPTIEKILPKLSDEGLFDSTTLKVDYSYACEDNSEELFRYKVRLEKDNIILEQSSFIFADKSNLLKNNIQYLFKSKLERGAVYTYYITYETINGYTEEVSETFTVSVTSLLYSDIISVVLNSSTSISDLEKLELENENGYVEVIAELKSEESLSEEEYDVVIARASARNNFLVWEDLYKTKAKIDLPITYLDMTAESGVFYKYGVQRILPEGGRSDLVITEPIVRHYEHMFLLGENDKMLKIKFNPKVNSYKYNVYDIKVDTIGSQYPFITRNAAVRYRTLPIEGLISFEIDDLKLFTTEEELYKYDEVIALQKTYYDNYTYERDFREKVFEFLLDGKAKLFKSPTEGNIIVRLMDVNSVPNQQLSRMIYNFSCTAHEIDKNSYDSLLKYNLIKKEE